VYLEVGLGPLCAGGPRRRPPCRTSGAWWVHKWVGMRRQRDQQTESLWDVADDGGFVVWCKRCGKDRTDSSFWMAGLS
jgi:hypothetical protein